MNKQLVIATFGETIGNVANFWHNYVKAKDKTEFKRNLKTCCSTMLPMVAAEKAKGSNRQKEVE